MNYAQYQHTRQQSPLKASRSPFGRSMHDSASIRGGGHHLKCEYLQQADGVRRCRKTDDGDNDPRCSINETTGRCRVAQPRAKPKPSVSSLADAPARPPTARPPTARPPTVRPPHASESDAFQRAIEELTYTKLYTQSRYEQRIAFESLSKLKYNPHYVSPLTGMPIADPYLQASAQVEAHANRRLVSASIPTSPSDTHSQSQSQSQSTSTSQSQCVKQTTAKYTSPSRKSPPYPANQCRGQTMVGNDGHMYHSTPNVRNVCTWKRISK
jgi:hypothetical protein